MNTAQTRSQQSPTRRLTALYVGALGLLALLLLAGFALTQWALALKSDEAHVINVAGRQRMLSQRLSKAALALRAATDEVSRSFRTTELRDTLEVWRRNHQGLLSGDEGLSLPGANSVEVTRLFAEIEPYYQVMTAAGEGLLAAAARREDAPNRDAEIRDQLEIILAAEASFLRGMEEIVRQYERESETRLSRLQGIELALLVVMLAEGLFVFRPATRRIRESIGELKRAQASLEREKKFVQLLQAIAVAANESATVEEAMQMALDRVCEHTGWPVGHAYARAQDSTDELVPTAIWHLDDPARFANFKEITEKTRFAPGVGLPGEVFLSGKAKWIADVTEAGANFPRTKQAQGIGIKSGFAFPVMVGTQIAAVLEFFSPEQFEPDAQLLEVAVHVGAQLGRVVERARAEEALRRSERRYRESVENSRGLICTHDLEGTLLSVNPAAAHALGYEPGEMISRNLAEFLPPSTRQRFGDYLRSAAKNAITNGSMRVVSKEGEERVWMFRNVRVAEEGKAPYVLGHAQDITAEKRAEAELQKLASIVESSDDAIISMSVDGTIQSWNAGAEKSFGYTARELIGSPITTLIPPERTGEELQIIERIKRGERIEHFETVRVRKDGSALDVSLTFSPIKDIHGQITGISKIARDIGKRKRTEAALRESEDKFRSIVETTVEWIWSINLEGISTYNNPAVEKILGYHPDELTGKPGILLMHEEERRRVEKMIPDSVSSRTGWTNLVFRWRHKDGSDRYLESNATPMLDANGELIGYWGADR
ncbi:MAG: PAS domain S-box protein, partial [Rubrivivax sp.]|nr:PAS domain S-box protein [Pyrinomonadaceae bacterium]